MKKRNFTKLFSFALTFILLFAFTANAEPRIDPRWSYLTSISAYIDISDNIASIEISADSDPNDVDKIKATCSLQRLDGSWKTIKTWTETDNSASILYDKTYAVYTGYSYRLKITVSVYNNNKLLESATEYYDYGYYDE